MSVANEAAKLPNLFDHARSELAQDAVLAYILRWASPDLPTKDHSSLRELGKNLLDALLQSVGVDPMVFEELKSLDVATQAHNIDVVVTVNNRIQLLIEDKTGTKEHSGQIKNYKKTLKNVWLKERKGVPLPDIWAVYIKTENEAYVHRPATADGHLFREDILKVLHQTPNTGNAIIEEWRQHLQVKQMETASFQEYPATQWSWYAWEGFFQSLEAWLINQTDADLGSDESYCCWGAVPSRSGAFLGFWWNWREDKKHKCRLYLQINSEWTEQTGRPEIPRMTPTLSIRVSDFIDEQGREKPVPVWLLRDILPTIQQIVEKSPNLGVTIKKPSRFSKGNTAAVAEIRFAEGETFLALNPDGTVDEAATYARLQAAMKLLNTVATS